MKKSLPLLMMVIALSLADLGSGTTSAEDKQDKYTLFHAWGFAMFDYYAASGTFTPATTSSKPPQGNDAKCGTACHTLAA